MAVGQFVSHQIWGGNEHVTDYCSMGVFRDKELIAGTLYHNWQPTSGVIELTSASVNRRWLTRSVIKAMFGMAFDMIGAQMVVLRVSECNTDMVTIAKRFGFSGVLIPRLRGRDEAEWIFSLTDDDWRKSRYAVDAAPLIR
jgi:RimJ/RimL family protein N-acetyltransferase